MPQQQTLIEKFYEWTRLKCRIQTASERSVYFKEREIWWASIGANIGSEENGKNKLFERPVLILKKFYGGEVIWVVPMTSTERYGYYYSLTEFHGRRYSFLLPQIRAISPKRLVRKLRTLQEPEFVAVKSRLKNFL